MLENLNQTYILHTIVIFSSLCIFAIGLVGVLSQKNLIKIFICFALMEGSLFLLFIGLHFDFDALAPIVTATVPNFSEQMVDPVPQAMILTTIIISIAVLALGISFITKYFQLTSNIDINTMDELGENR